MFLLEGVERTFVGVPTGTWIVRVVGGGLSEAETRVEIREDEVATVALAVR